MTSQGIWCLEGTPGILEVYNCVDSPSEDHGNDSNDKRAKMATKLLETLENFNYGETESTDSYIPDWLSTEETSIQLPSIFEDCATLPTAPVVGLLSSPLCAGPGGGFYNARGTLGGAVAKPGYEAAGVPWVGVNKKVGYEWTADASLYSPPGQATSWPQPPEYPGVPNQLTPPCSPLTMYEATPPDAPKPEFDDLAEDLLKPGSDQSNIKEENALLSLLAEMNPKDLDDFVVRSAEENFGIQACDGYSYTTETSYILPSDVPLSPDHSCSSDSFGYHSESDHSSSDPDYNPNSPEVTRKVPKTPVEASRTATATKLKSARASSTPRASKPYARKAPVPVADKKLRKKEQNKNAATRYRIKKKMEVEEILGEESGLRTKNEELKSKAEDLNREIRFMKKFMRDFFKTQGVLK